MRKNILILPGDGIGPEIVAEAVKVLELLKHEGEDLSWSFGLLGGAAVDAEGSPYPESTQQAARAADAILMGAVGGPKYDDLPRELRPERGILGIRKDLGLFANLRPALAYEALAAASSFKPEIIAGLDILILRELTGDIYFGQPRGRRTNADGEDEGFDTMHYARSEIERIGHVAFQAAQKRNKRLCSVDKENVLDTSRLWREVMTGLAPQYPDVALTHMYVDNAAMQLVKRPKQFDVMVSGSIGMLPSASLDVNNKGLYEPIHGSAPDIMGQNKANPLATILSVGMMFKYSFDRADVSARIEAAVKAVLEAGHRTGDIAMPGEAVIGTREMGEAFLLAMKR